MNPFVSIVNFPLVVLGPTDGPNCAINEFPAVIQCSTSVVDSMCTHLQELWGKPWLVQVSKPVSKCIIYKINHKVSYHAELRHGSSKLW